MINWQGLLSAPALHTALRIGTGVLASLLLIVLTAAAWYWRDLPPLTKATDYRPQQHLQVFTSDGVEIAQFGAERRLFVPIEQVPETLRNAVLATEDAQFYEHPGISFRGLVRATLANISGSAPQGASTITQQVARTFFLSTRRTPERKIKEALLALQLERRLSKDKILELYLNQIYLGQRAYGFGAAAQTYFGKPLAELDLAEHAMLAGLPQNPIHANPVTSPTRATRRQHWVLQRMVATGFISTEQQAAAVAQKLRLRSPDVVDVHAGHVADMARRAAVEQLGDRAYTDGIRVVTTLRAEDQRAAHAALRRAVLAHERKQPWRGPEDHEALPDDQAAAERAAALVLKDQRDDHDLRVAIVLQASPREVTLRLVSGETIVVRGEGLLPGVQAALSARAPPELAITRGSIVRVLQRPQQAEPPQHQQRPESPASRTKGQPAQDRPVEWQLAQWPQVDGAFVALDPATGRIRALVGGFDFNRHNFNRATSAARQPGSSLKPFLYSAAFEHGVMPETLVEDAPLGAPDGAAPAWNPQNSDGQFDGPISVREALVRSKNLVSVRLLQYVGLTVARDWLARIGFDAARLPKDLTLALGTGSVTPLELAQGYAVLANGGHRVTPLLVERITDARGQILFQAAAVPALHDKNRVLPARNVFMINSLLADVTHRGTAARAQAVLQRPDLYGKTGTTNDAVDAWFAGHAPGVAAVAWIGYDEPRSLGERESGGGLALPVWIDVMKSMLRDVPVKVLLPPAGLIDSGGDWRYEELAEGGFIERIGRPMAPSPGSNQAGEQATPAASAASAAPRPASAASR